MSVQGIIEIIKKKIGHSLTDEQVIIENNSYLKRRDNDTEAGYESEIALYFVAMTRGKEKLYIVG